MSDELLVKCGRYAFDETNGNADNLLASKSWEVTQQFHWAAKILECHHSKEIERKKLPLGLQELIPHKEKLGNNAKNIHVSAVSQQKVPKWKNFIKRWCASRKSQDS